MKRRKAPQTTTMENVARAIGSTIGVAVRTAGEVVDDLANAAKKARGKLPKKKARKKIVTRAKKLVGAGAKSVKRTAKNIERKAKKIVRAAKSPKRPKKRR